MTKEQLKIIEHLKKMQTDPEYKENYLLKKLSNDEVIILKYLNRIDKFETADDVPNLPVVDKDKWNNVYVPKLIEKGAIAKNQLEDGKWYYGEHRRCNLAKWNEKLNKFDYLRFKFGYMWDDCNHFEDDNGFALFIPLREANEEEKLEQENINNNLDKLGRNSEKEK